MADDRNAEALRNINQRFVSDDPSNKLPIVTTPDGTRIQTGTVGALIQNIKLYDRICAGETVQGLDKSTLEEMLTIPISTLEAVGLFDIFPADDWVIGSSQGRKFVGEKAKQMGL